MTAATSLVPSDEEATDIHKRVVSRAVQLTPASVEVWIWPLMLTATSLLPSAEEATEIQLRFVSRAVQLTPKSVEV